MGSTLYASGKTIHNDVSEIPPAPRQKGEIDGHFVIFNEQLTSFGTSHGQRRMLLEEAMFMKV